MTGRIPRYMVLLPDQLREAIDAHQREAGIISRNETIRRLIEAGLKAERAAASRAPARQREAAE